MIRHTLPDGRVAEFPDGTPPDVVERTLRGLTAPAPAAPPAVIEQVSPTEGMSAAELALAGIGQGLTDAARGIGQWVPVVRDGRVEPLVTAADVAEARRLDGPLLATAAGLAGNVAGSVVGALPYALVPGAGTVRGLIGLGALGGALAPAETGLERAAQVALGGAAGAAVPLAAGVTHGVGAALAPFTETGRAKILAHALTKAAGPHPVEAARALVGVPPVTEVGVRPTLGEAARAAGREASGLAALERAAGAADPLVMGEIAARRAANQQAMREALDAVTPDAAALKASRAAEARELYERARELGFAPEALAQHADRIADIRARMPARIQPELDELARISGMSPTAPDGVEALHWMKQALDDRVAALRQQDAGSMLHHTARYRDDFLGLLDDLSPAYKTARERYAQASRPIDQGEILAEVLRRGMNQVREELTPAAFIRAIDDRTARAVTGMPDATMDAALEPGQRAVLRGIAEALRDVDFAGTAGRGVGSDTVQKLAFQNLLGEWGVPDLLRNFAPARTLGGMAARVADLAYGGAGPAMARQLGDLVLDPRAAGQLMLRQQAAGVVDQAARARALRALVPAAAATPTLGD